MKVQVLLPNHGVASATVSRSTKIAYFILVHRFPKQFKRLFAAIYDSENYYLIHLDKKADAETKNDVRIFLAAYPNAHVLESANVVWGGYSMVQAELDGMKYLLSLHTDWDFFINLSGQDFPLKSQQYIQRFLKENKNKSFIKLANQAEGRPDTMNRIENYFTETETGFSKLTYKRAYLKDVTSYIGGQWFIFSRACCEFISYSPEVRKFEQYYLNTLIADESFFQTVLMNTSFTGAIVNDDKRAIIWIPDGDIKLRPKTFTIHDLNFLMDSDCLFARKFDDQTDGEIIDSIEANISEQIVQRRSIQLSDASVL